MGMRRRGRISVPDFKLDRLHEPQDTAASRCCGRDKAETLVLLSIASHHVRRLMRAV